MFVYWMSVFTTHNYGYGSNYNPTIFTENPFVSVNPIDLNMNKIIERCKNRISIETGDGVSAVDFVQYLQSILVNNEKLMYKDHSMNVLTSLSRAYASSMAEIKGIKDYVKTLDPSLNSTQKANELVRLLTAVQTSTNTVQLQAQSIINVFQFYYANQEYFVNIHTKSLIQ